MADLETMHKIIEKIEVLGDKESVAAFEKLAQVTQKLSASEEKLTEDTKQLSFGFSDAAKEAEKMANKVVESGQKQEKAVGKWTKMWGKAKDILKESTGSMFKQFAAVEILKTVIGKATATLKAFVDRAWNVSKAFEAATSRVEGMILGLTDFGKMDPMAQLAYSTQAAGAVMSEFRDIAMKTATEVPEIEHAYARISPILMNLGKSQLDVLKLTEKATSTAKVYGEQAGIAAGIVAKAAAVGVVEGETAFAQAFKAAAGISSKMGMEERMRRINATLEDMGRGVGIVTKDTDGALSRWKILSDDVLQRVTLPLYDKIGSVVAEIVDFAEAHKATLDDIVVDATEWFESVFAVAEGLWDTVTILSNATGLTDLMVANFEVLWGLGKAFFKVIDAVGTSFKTIGELVKAIAEPDRGMSKMLALSESLEIKLLKIVQIFSDMVSTIADFAVPDWLEDKLPDSMKGFIAEMKTSQKVFDKYLEDKERRVASLQKDLGMSPTTEIGREMERREKGIGLSKSERQALLGGRKGKPIINIQKVEIRQDFRDADPDRVFVEFTKDMENLGEAALQSSVGGDATELEAGTQMG